MGGYSAMIKRLYRNEPMAVMTFLDTIHGKFMAIGDFRTQIVLH